MPTPLMEQYLSLKSRHPNELLLFRCGDFYELFYDDARIASETLGITLTQRSKEEGVPMAGVPYHAVEGYIRRLLGAGKRVAIAEQMSDPKDSPGLIVRDVTEVVTPGTVTEWSMLDERAATHLCAIAPGAPPPPLTLSEAPPQAARSRRGAEARVGVAWLDVSTGRFLVEDIPLSALEEELARIAPAETLVPDGARGDELRTGALRGRAGTPYPAFAFEEEAGRKKLHEHFAVATLEGFGLDGVALGLGAAGALLRYLGETKKDHLRAVARLERFARETTLVLDPATRRALELVETARTRERKGSLLQAIDRTQTAMGGRLLREELQAPLRTAPEIARRHDALDALHAAPGGLAALGKALEGIQDLERLAGRSAALRATPRDIAALRASLEKIPEVRLAIAPAAEKAPLLAELALEADPQEQLAREIAATLLEAPPLSSKEGGIVREGVDPELDRLRSLSREGKDFIALFQKREVERSGIPSLKVGHNSVFGYYIEITNAHQEKVPKDYQRKQTLKNAERYVTQELKDYEHQVVTAKERSDALEQRIFERLRARAGECAEALRRTARAVSRLDLLRSLAVLAAERRYVRPKMVPGPRLILRDARHPVLEQSALGEPFVPNDLSLDEEKRIAVVTGPNMAGKSTFCRQTALIVLLAQMGGFVPAAEAEIGITDRIFARIGAADEIARGLSTFMVEMTETANILHNASEQSLVILDEVGRGTSTFDGVSLAFAITEHLSEKVRARTLFATHYHELTELAEVDPRVKNLNVAVKEWGEEIVFLRKIVEGAADKSYGLHVARLAGVPRSVIERAKEVLASLERLQIDGAGRPRLARRATEPERKRPKQLALFAPEEEKMKAALLGLDISNMRPVEALSFLADWQERLRQS